MDQAYSMRDLKYWDVIALEWVYPINGQIRSIAIGSGQIRRI